MNFIIIKPFLKKRAEGIAGKLFKLANNRPPDDAEMTGYRGDFGVQFSLYEYMK